MDNSGNFHCNGNWEVNGIRSYMFVEEKYWVINWIRLATVCVWLPVSLHAADPNILPLMISKTFPCFWSQTQSAQRPRKRSILFLSGLRVTSFPTTQLPFFPGFDSGKTTIFKGNSTHSHKELLSPIALGLKIIRLIDHMLPRV